VEIPVTEIRLIDLSSLGPVGDGFDSCGFKGEEWLGTPHPWPGWHDERLPPADLAAQVVELDWWGGLDRQHLADVWGADLDASYVLAADFTPFDSSVTDTLEAADFLGVEPASVAWLAEEPSTVMRVVPYRDGLIVADASFSQMAKAEVWAGALATHLDGHWPGIVATTMAAFVNDAGESNYQCVSFDGLQVLPMARHGRYSLNGERERRVIYRGVGPGWPMRTPAEIKAVLDRTIVDRWGDV